MLVIFDHSTPAPLAAFLAGHTVTEARDRGWDTLSNGDLLAEAERAGFDVLLTADQSIRYQQNLAGRQIALVVLSTPQWPRVRLQTEEILAAVNSATQAVMSKFLSDTSCNSPADLMRLRNVTDEIRYTG